MTLVGKIFVLIITGMSFVLFSLSWVFLAKHEDWRKVSLEHQATVAAIKKESQDLTAINTTLTEHLNTAKGEHDKTVAAVQAKYNVIAGKNGELLATFNKVENELQTNIETISATSVTIGENMTMIQILTKDTNEAQSSRNAYLRDLAKTMAIKYDQASILQNIEESNKELLATYDSAKQVLDKFQLEAKPELYGHQPRFTVQGLVENVQSNDGKNLMITVGASDGLKPGHFLEVYRGNSYLGRIMVLSTEPNRAVCKIIPEFRQGLIQQGDTVTSKIM